MPREVARNDVGIGIPSMLIGSIRYNLVYAGALRLPASTRAGRFPHGERLKTHPYDRLGRCCVVGSVAIFVYDRMAADGSAIESFVNDRNEPTD